MFIIILVFDLFVSFWNRLGSSDSLLSLDSTDLFRLELTLANIFLVNVINFNLSFFNWMSLPKSRLAATNWPSLLTGAG